MTKWTVAGLLFISQFVINVIRVALGVVAPTLISVYGISPQAMGVVLSAYSWVFTPGVLLAGPVVDKCGPWIVTIIGSGIWGMATLTLPLFAAAAGSLFLMRALFGFGHVVFVPVQASAVAQWFRADERATATGLGFSGGITGLAVGTTVAAFLLDRLGWKAVFYCLGGASLLFTAIWTVLYPRERITTRSEPVLNRGFVSLLSLLRHRATWGLMFGQMGYLYAYFFFMSWLPAYLIMERKMSLLRTGVVASLPFWAGLIGTLGGGWLGDYLIRRGLSPMASRKGIIGAGYTVATIMIVSAAYSAQTWLAVVLLTLCMLCMRITTASANSLPIDLAPRGVIGALASLQSFGGNIGGLSAPILTGYIVQTTGSFVGAFVAAGGILVAGGFSYVLLVKSLEGHLDSEPVPSPAGI